MFLVYTKNIEHLLKTLNKKHKLLQQFSSDKIPKAANYNVIIFDNPSYTIFNLFVIRFLFFSIDFVIIS